MAGADPFLLGSAVGGAFSPDQVIYLQLSEPVLVQREARPVFHRYSILLLLSKKMVSSSGIHD